MFAVLDVETTGLRPGGPDRVIEIAVVRVGDDHEVVDEWTTLVDPGRPVRGSRIHGIYTRHVRGAPTFSAIAGDLAERLADSVVVAHNARFDSAFIEAEFRRAGHDVPCEWLCTLQLVDRLGFGPTHTLRACCQNLGVSHEDGHAALIDARATARLLVYLLAAAYEREVSLPLPPPLARTALPRVAACGRCLVRPVVEDRSPRLRRAVPNVPPPAVPDGADPSAVIAYTEMLDRVLEDGMVTRDEAAALCDLAASWGLTANQASRIHRTYLSDLVSVAMDDGVLSREEHEDLRHFADLLGVERQTVLEHVIARMWDAEPPKEGD